MRRGRRGFAAALGLAAAARVPQAFPRPVSAAAADGVELREQQVPPRRHADPRPAADGQAGGASTGRGGSLGAGLHLRHGRHGTLAPPGEVLQRAAPGRPAL